MYATAMKQIEDARAMGAKIRFVLDSNDGGVSSIHSYSELFDAPLGKSIEGCAYVYDAGDPTRSVAEPVRDPSGIGLNMSLVQQAIERALEKFKASC
jgi:hypothetical protein